MAVDTSRLNLPCLADVGGKDLCSYVHDTHSESSSSILPLLPPLWPGLWGVGGVPVAIGVVLHGGVGRWSVGGAAGTGGAVLSGAFFLSLF